MLHCEYICTNLRTIRRFGAKICLRSEQVAQMHKFIFTSPFYFNFFYFHHLQFFPEWVALCQNSEMQRHMQFFLVVLHLFFYLRSILNTIHLSDCYLCMWSGHRAVIFFQGGDAVRGRYSHVAAVMEGRVLLVAGGYSGIARGDLVAYKVPLFVSSDQGDRVSESAVNQ